MDIKSYGRLFLIPVTLGEVNPLEVLPLSVRKVVEMVDHYIVENEKTARRFIKSINPGKSQPSLHFSSINKFTQVAEIPGFLDPCLEGKDMGLMSEAGVPGIADPGAEIVGIAHQKNIRVQPLVGPSSILMAMMSSGLNGQNFAFNGYLPIDKAGRRSKIRELEAHSRQTGQSQAFIETPYRNNKLLDELVSTLNSGTQLCVACDISLPSEFIKTLTVSQWKMIREDFHKRPAIFIIQG
ncbi:SAM-dependent methyltransferase [Nonlabens xiamenensis]|uniref:SAM-dependent methyltransferase n=1 Tax=Nonlabens xiamenensis TaxID=2341043 RepID=UPI000F604CC6|nr:SAM-dependent methyltransferase [Nonlabens xiamenensis]